MQNFMLNITLQGLETETRMQLLPQEQAVVKELEAKGIILHTFIKQDMSGVFMVCSAENEAMLHEQLALLPYYPYMKIELSNLRA
jgi:muconolactone delta-isomerase